MRILITAGATREPVDGVRFITNFSTGATGAFLAERFTGAGHEVVLVHGKGSVLPAVPDPGSPSPESALRLAEYESFADLNQLLMGELGAQAFDAVIHAAAVSDFSVEKIRSGGVEFDPPVNGKLSSGIGSSSGSTSGERAGADPAPAVSGSAGPMNTGDRMELVLRRNFKILDRLKDYARRQATVGRQEALPLIIAFKLTRTGDEQKRLAAVDRILAAGGADLVVHNDLGEITPGPGGRHPFRIFARGREPLASGNSKEDLYDALSGILEKGTAP